MRCAQLATSDALLEMDLSAVLALGDLQYEDGQLAKFLASFDPTWGRLKPLIRPVVGNHEYRVPGAAGYFDYFNGVGGPTDPPARCAGYSASISDAWHRRPQLPVLARTAPGRAVCAAGSPQERWLRADLAAHPAGARSRSSTTRS